MYLWNFGVFVLVLFCSRCSSSPSVVANTDDFGGVAPNVVDGCEGVAPTSDGRGGIVSDVQVCRQRLSSAFELIGFFLFSNPNPNPNLTPNNATLANMDT